MSSLICLHKISGMAYDASNPFFRFDLDKLCAICHKKLENNKKHSIHDEIPKCSPKVDAFEVLQSFSKYNCENGPQNICAACFNNAIAVHKFQAMCNKANENIWNYLNYQENMKNIKEESTEDVTINPSFEEPMVESQVYDSASVSNANREGVKDGPSKRTKCKVCDKMYRRDYLPLHMRTHSGEKPYKCKICPKQFAQPAAMKFHMASHENDRSHMCNFCGATFILKCTLQRHERSHTGEKPYKCDQCILAFVCHGSLKRHKITHTDEKPFTCEYCAKSFNRRSTLRVHLKIHTNDKPHMCHICDKAFIQAHVLKSHLEMHAKQDRKIALSQCC